MRRASKPEAQPISGELPDLPLEPGPDDSPRGEPSGEELARYRWAEMARGGRHGYAARGTGAVAVLGSVVLSVASILPPEWLVATRGDGFAWLLVLGVPALAAVYAVLLAQWDQEARRFGGGPVTLDAWRDGEDDGCRESVVASRPPTR